MRTKLPAIVNSIRQLFAIDHKLNMFQLKQIIMLSLFSIVLINTCQSLNLIENNLNPQQRTKIDDDLRDFVEFIKLQMQCGYEPAGVPPLAPYQAEFKEFNVQGNTYG